MLDRKRGSFKWLAATLNGHLSLWVHSLRTILMVIFILLMTYMLIRSYEQSVFQNMFNAHLWEMLYVYAKSGFNLIMTSVAFLVMMSEIPKRVAYQHYALMRLSRRKWLASLIIFCIGIVFLFTVLMLVSSALFSSSFITPGSGWSDLERLEENVNYINEPQLVAVYIRSLTPTAACALASVVLFFFWVTMAFIILLFSLWGTPNFGVVLCVSLLLLHITVLFESLPGMKLPSQYATLSAIAAQAPDHELSYTLKVLVGYVMIDALLIALMGLRVRHMDIQFTGKG